MSHLHLFYFILVHAAIIAINDAIEHQDAAETIKALQNPAAMLVNCLEEFSDSYQIVLLEAKQIKAENARNKVRIMADICKHLLNNCF